MKEPIDQNRIAQHHYLVAGEITFAEQQDDQSFIQNLVKLNCVIYSEKNKIRVQELGKAQQTLQMQFFKQLGNDPKLLARMQITNVCVLGMTYCGHMSQEEFNAAPEGMKIQEKQEKLMTNGSELDKFFARSKV